ncbi:MAG: hypothetical protein QW257_03530 [Candidatus Micrarchaeaceae archaeon]
MQREKEVIEERVGDYLNIAYDFLSKSLPVELIKYTDKSDIKFYFSETTEYFHYNPHSDSIRLPYDKDIYIDESYANKIQSLLVHELLHKIFQDYINAVKGPGKLTINDKSLAFFPEGASFLFEILYLTKSEGKEFSKSEVVEKLKAAIKELNGSMKDGQTPEEISSWLRDLIDLLKETRQLLEDLTGTYIGPHPKETREAAEKILEFYSNGKSESLGDAVFYLLNEQLSRIKDLSSIKR